MNVRGWHDACKRRSAAVASAAGGWVVGFRDERDT